MRMVRRKPKQLREKGSRIKESVRVIQRKTHLQGKLPISRSMRLNRVKEAPVVFRTERIHQMVL